MSSRTAESSRSLNSNLLTYDPVKREYCKINKEIRALRRKLLKHGVELGHFIRVVAQYTDVDLAKGLMVQDPKDRKKYLQVADAVPREQLRQKLEKQERERMERHRRNLLNPHKLDLQ